jgi:hypothetical protein
LLDQRGLAASDLVNSKFCYAAARGPFDCVVIVDRDGRTGCSRNGDPDVRFDAPGPGESARAGGAFVPDPDGQTIKAVCHAPE